MPAKRSGSVPAVLILAGSGPTDRNGNAVPSLRSNLYAQLAWRLGERGIGSLRYDKRGVGASRTSPASPGVTLDDLASDATAAAALLKSIPGISRIVIAGHSEGAWLAIRAAGAGAPVAGMVLMSGVGRKISEVIGEQLATQIDTAAAQKFKELFPRYLAGENLGTTPGNLQPILLPEHRIFMKTLADFDAPAELKRVRVPVLIIQGDLDVQVTVRDAQLLKAAKPDAKLVVLPGANHVYKKATSRDRMVQLALYVDPTIPVVSSLVDEIAGWVQSLK
jgi:pimeloyl-ACP methyl ester carboxylesterase